MAQWFVAAKRADFQKIAEDNGIDPVTARIIRNRDIITEEEIRKFLSGGREDLYSPLLLKDMEKAVAMIRRKIEQGAKLRVIGDYDADGICSSYILVKGLTACGAKVDTVIPHRIRDGYGLNEGLIAEAHNDEVDTIITCDNGIAAAAQIAYAGELGMTVIVTDHHEIPYEERDGKKCFLMPEAAAVIDPKREDCGYPFPNICGGTVAYKTMEALFAKCHPKGETELLEEFLEIAAFATVCDVMELRDENRIIVKCGLANMHRTRNMGLKALIEVCGLEEKKLSAYHIGFILGPCMNATGRLDTAKRALSLLQCTERAEAVKIAAELKNLNESRKEMTRLGVEQAKELIEGSSLREDKVLVVFMPEIHESLAGIIAGRLREKYGKPVFVLTRGEEEVKGSGRSIEGYDMYQELTACKELFIKYGGHKMAAGLSLKEENMESFRSKINERCILSEEDFEEKVHIDAAMPLTYISPKLIKELEVLEPFGAGNKKPVFAQKEIHIVNGRILGKNKNVGRYGITDGGNTFYEMMYFGDIEAFHVFLEEKTGKTAVNELLLGNRVDIPISITYYPAINSFAGKENLQIIMQNYR